LRIGQRRGYTSDEFEDGNQHGFERLVFDPRDVAVNHVADAIATLSISLIHPIGDVLDTLTASTIHAQHNNEIDSSVICARSSTTSACSSAVNKQPAGRLPDEDPIDLGHDNDYEDYKSSTNVSGQTVSIVRRSTTQNSMVNFCKNMSSNPPKARKDHALLASYKHMLRLQKLTIMVALVAYLYKFALDAPRATCCYRARRS
jgi:hypothetical protein